ncbi:P-loop containing nucleoside triphosphate hydrolase protein [Lipomyces oligophaga]|uniref:P-loop containing nucleoside triphosphate hydrolase protein n=1 Tax=Lipomyces oligophaga TaxID=45792 RepID=UPI0034CE077E
MTSTERKGPVKPTQSAKHLRTRPTDKQSRRAREREDLQELKQRTLEFDSKEAATFDDLPISQATAIGLKQSHFTTLTDIQKAAIAPALRGNDILGAARTGSGKTLAFLIPLLECLYRNQWTQYDGLGALVVSPTRELAIQIFDVLRKIGRAHSFSAGLVMGGKDVQVERERIGRLNILVGTPGRILQHLDQAAGFDISNLKILILDEADRILDMGFRKTVDAIVEHLPRERQTLLFSATQTKSVSDLARLSLSAERAQYISAHETSTISTPQGLKQYYVITPLYEKLDTLFGFLKTHLKAKVIVFLSSSKQVRFVFETFKTLHPGIPLLHLHGRQKQAARIDVTDRFSEAQYACLFCTDIVARGIDFPSVDWVVQVDAPEDADTYVHRVGRTARFEASGRALLMLTPSEEVGMLSRLATKKVPIEKITIKESKKKSIRPDLQALCFKNPDIKYLGQKAFISYCKSIYIQKDKEVFKIADLPATEYAESLGLPGAPKIKFLNVQKAKQMKNALKVNNDSDGSEDYDEPNKRDQTVRTKYDRMFERQNQGVLSQHYLNLIQDDEIQKSNADEEEDQDFLTVKRYDHGLIEEEDQEDEDKDSNSATYFGVEGAPVSKRQAKMALSKKAMLKFKKNPTKLTFDDEGHPHALYEFEREDDFKKHGATEEQIADFLDKEGGRMKQIDAIDKQVARDKRTEKKRKQKEKLAAREDSDREDEPAILLAEQEQEEQLLAGEKRPRKWFEDDEKSESKKLRSEYSLAPPESLEDLEALSKRLLGSN